MLPHDRIRRFSARSGRAIGSLLFSRLLPPLRQVECDDSHRRVSVVHVQPTRWDHSQQTLLRLLHMVAQGIESPVLQGLDGSFGLAQDGRDCCIVLVFNELQYDDLPLIAGQNLNSFQ